MNKLQDTLVSFLVNYFPNPKCLLALPGGAFGIYQKIVMAESPVEMLDFLKTQKKYFVQPILNQLEVSLEVSPSLEKSDFKILSEYIHKFALSIISVLLLEANIGPFGHGSKAA